MRIADTVNRYVGHVRFTQNLGQQKLHARFARHGKQNLHVLYTVRAYPADRLKITTCTTTGLWRD